ncbi:MAG: 4-(cytidine 5'-diphospho)-2-C-methyl-D-erythritol kinase [Candidatus Saganbacteria bacterium]|nr:4-(cytidine 5'-diphospho)-2-C-methyl-D-erythritol kinase [Candidatus Saganbacteria bacterium]
MKLKAFAKLNLSLRVFARRPDGYHDLESVMQSVSLYDVITLEPIDSGIAVACDDPNVPTGKENLVYKAAELFRKSKIENRESKMGVRIHIEKHIPMAAGLAGGSADAAAVLYGLDQMQNAACRIRNEGLLSLGAQIGSDVPFCLTGGTCLVQGRGEIVDKQEPWPRTYFILVCPDIHVSTKWAYDEFDRLHIEAPDGIKNDLEPVVVEKHEEIADIKEKLVKLGCVEAQMSGSGPSVFGVCRHQSDARKILLEIKARYPRSFLIETVDKGIELVGIS